MASQDIFVQAIEREDKLNRTVHRRILNRVKRLLPTAVQRFLTSRDRARARRILKRFARVMEGQDVCLVQIAACDGTTGDPVYRYATEHGWKGVVVEPVPSNFKKLQAAYQGVESIRCVQAAIAEEDGEKPFYYCRRDSEELPIWYEQIGSFDRGHITKHTILDPDVENHIVETSVRCFTLSTLLDQNDIGRLDLLHTDVEGFDYHIIKQIPFGRVRPSIVLFENLHMSEQFRVAAREMFESQGYTVVSDSMDTIAYLPGALDSKKR